MFFLSPASNITPALTSVAMSRSDSRDSTAVTVPALHAPSDYFSAAPMAVSYSVSPAHTRPYAMIRTISNTSSQGSAVTSSSFSDPLASMSASSRRGSASQGAFSLPSPYRSCMHHSSVIDVIEPSSYLSDDDLLFLAAPPNDLPVELIPNLEPRKKELTTEEQIAMLREMQEREQEREQQFAAQQPQDHGKKRAVRFAGAVEATKPRRPSTLRRRGPTVRRGLSSLNGPM